MYKKHRGRKRIYPLNKWSQKTITQNGKTKQVLIKPNLIKGIQKRKTKYHKWTKIQSYRRLGKWHGQVDPEIIAALEELQKADVEYSILLRNYNGKKYPEYKNKYEIAGLEGIDTEVPIHNKSYDLNIHTHPARSFSEFKYEKIVAPHYPIISTKMSLHFPTIKQDKLDDRLEYLCQNLWDDIPSADDLQCVLVYHTPITIITPHYNITITKDDSVKVLQGKKYMHYTHAYKTSYKDAQEKTFQHIEALIPTCRSLDDFDMLIENECKKFQHDRAAYARMMHLRMTYHKKNTNKPLSYQPI